MPFACSVWERRANSFCGVVWTCELKKPEGRVMKEPTSVGGASDTPVIGKNLSASPCLSWSWSEDLTLFSKRYGRSGRSWTAGEKAP